MSYQTNTTHQQSGFSIVEALIVIIVVSLIGFIGYRVWGSYSAANTPVAETSTQTSPIASAADLAKTDQELSQLDVEGSDLTDLEAQTDY